MKSLRKFWIVCHIIGTIIGYLGIYWWMIGTYFVTNPDPNINRTGILSLIILVTSHLKKCDQDVA